MGLVDLVNGASPPGSVEAPRLLSVEVVHCAGRGLVDAMPLQVSAGTTVQQALLQSGLAHRHPGLDWAAPGACGVWGKLVALDRPLNDGDRLEVYRPLQVDPMHARRERHRQQRGGRSGKRATRAA